MPEKIKNNFLKYTLHRLLNALILAGIILFFTGLYYSVIKAGIPYQDPPLELQIQYTVNMRIGEILLRNGLLIVVCSGILRLIWGWMMKKYQQK